MNTGCSSVLESFASTQKITISYKLEAVICLLLSVRMAPHNNLSSTVREFGFKFRVPSCIVYLPFLLVHDILIQTTLCAFTAVWCGYPVDGSFYFSSVRAGSALGSPDHRLQCTTVTFPFSSFSNPVQVTKYASIRRTSLPGNIRTIFLRRLFHEVFSLDINLTAKWNVTASQVPDFPDCYGHSSILSLSFRIVIDHQLYRIQNRHHTGRF